MSSLGKIIGAAIYGSAETTVALANINFDFSLMKVDAPTEFLGLGASLSKQRKGDAEEGFRHVTARKLGALFESALPETPHLIQAYGKRVTEIAGSPKVNPKGTPADGPFADHVGADGTTIWAAATSGKCAIAVHLLACMLARMWPQGESISIWSEFVEQRKSLLQKEVIESTSFHLSDLSAAKTHISRDQLADWDSSARQVTHGRRDKKRP